MLNHHVVSLHTEHAAYTQYARDGLWVLACGNDYLTNALGTSGVMQFLSLCVGEALPVRNWAVYSC